MPHKSSRHVNVIIIFMLVFQTLFTSFVLPGQSIALGHDDQFIDTVSYDAQQLEDEGTAPVTFEWSVADLEVEVGEVYQSPIVDNFIIDEDQSGDLLTDEEEKVGQFSVSSTGIVSLVFTEEINDNPDAAGSFVVEAVKKDEAKQTNEEEVKGTDGIEKDDVDEAETTKEESIVVEEESNEDKTKVKENDAAENSVQSEENVEEEANLDVTEQTEEHEVVTTDEVVEDEEEADKKTGFSFISWLGGLFSTNNEEGTVITENIITDVEVFLDSGDGYNKVMKEDIIRVEDPYNEFKVKIHYDFALPNGHGYSAGATFIIELPEMLTIQNNPDPIPLLDDENVEFATFIVNDDKIIITFNENIENNDNVSGYIDAESEFDLHYKGAADTNLTFPISGESDLKIPIKFISKGSSISKSGIGNRGYNTETITWTVDFNKDYEEIENAVLNDEITEGNHEFVSGSLKLYELELNADGTVRNTTEVTENYGNEFPLNLGKIDSPYRVVYETKVNDREGTVYKNKATLSGDGVDPVSSESTVKVARGEALAKSSSHYDDVAQTILWEVKYNYDEKNIEQAQAKLTDKFTVGGSKQQLDLNSFEVYEVTINQDTGEEAGTSLVDPSQYSVTPLTEEVGFELQFNSDINKAYKIYYKTETTERVLDGFDVENTISDEFENTRKGGEFVTQGVFIKSHDGNTNYNDKKTDWKILINRDKQTMSDVVFYDTLPEGMTPENVFVTHGETTLVIDTDYSLTTSNEGNRIKITIDFINDITDVVYITYTTNIDFDQAGWEPDKSYTNTSSLEWIPWNETNKITKTGTAIFNPDEFTQHNGFKSADYNPVTREITWTIGVNYNKANLENVVVEDFIERADDQDFNIDNVKVYEMNLTGADNGFELGNEVTTYNVESATSEGKPGFRVNFGNIAEPYVIQYTTILDGYLIEGVYNNKATIETTNGKNSELEASIKPYEGKEYTEKNAVQNHYNPRIVNWTMNINFNQSMVTNLTIEDTPSINQSIIKDSFKLYGTTVTESGVVKNPNNVLTEGIDYTVSFEEVGEEGQEKFIFKTLPENEASNAAYVLEYDTYILYTGGEYNRITNEAGFHANEGVSEQAGDTFDEFIELSTIGGGITGNVGRLQITKKSDDPLVTNPLAGAEFELYDLTGEVLLRTGTTDGEGVVTFKNLLQGKYLLKEITAPNYHVIGQNVSRIVEVDKAITELEITNEKIKQHFELTKIDDKDKTPLVGAEFDLYEGTYPSGTKVNDLNLVTDENGKILVEYLPGGNRDDGIPAGDYYLLETKTANEHYKLSTEPIPFTIKEGQTVVTIVNAVNKLQPGSVSFTKTDGETNSQLAGAEFNIVYVSYNGKNYNETVKNVTTSVDEATVIDNLRPGEYKLVETKAPTGYKPLENEIPFTIVESQETTLQLDSIKNEVKTTSIELTKQDAKITSKKLEDVSFELTYHSGEYEDSFNSETKSTNSSGVIEFTNLKPGIYHITEKSTPEGYIENNEPIVVEVTLNHVHNGTTVTTTANNDPFAEIILEKRNSETNHLLEGAVFNVVNQANNLEVLTGLTTNENGRIHITGLPAGNYKLVETASPNGYHNPGEDSEFEREFNITGNETTTNTIEFVDSNAVKNYIVKGSLEITKQDAEDENTKLSDVEFTLQSVTLADGHEPITITGIKTKVDGKVTVDNLWPGTYKLIETEAAEGYQKHWKEIDITINKQNEKHEAAVTVENYKLVDIQVTKVWKDDENTDSRILNDQQIHLVRQVSGGTEETVNSVDLEAVDKTYTFTELPVVNDLGQPYVYSVKEDEVSGYATEITNDGDNFIITNTRSEDTSISGTKHWDFGVAGEQYIPDQITVKLLNEAKKVVQTQTVTADSDGNWEYSFNDIPRFDENGIEIKYTVKEEEIIGFDSAVDGFDIYNTQETIEIEVTKNWIEVDSQYRPTAVTIQVKNDNEVVASHVLTDEREKDEWTYTFTNLPKYDKDGNGIAYTIDEIEPAGYEKSIEGNEITNEQILTDIIVTKKWAEGDSSNRPDEITVQLKIGDEVVSEHPLSGDKNAGTWTHTFTNLPMYDADGNVIEYSVDEVVPPGYKKSIDGYEITNTRAELRDITVTKQWLDNNSPERPDSIQVQLYQNGDSFGEPFKILADEEWTYVFEELEAFDENGIAYEYTIEELPVDGYEPSIDGFEITNVRVGTTEVTGTKTWKDDNEADRPASIKVNLLQNGVVIDTKEVTATDDWTYSFTDLDKYDEDGVEYEYTIAEHDVPGYQSEVDGFNLINTRSEERDITVTKAWVNDNETLRPDAITVTLFQNGEEYKTVQITAANDWKYTFENVPSFDEDGVAYEYTIDEASVPSYETTIDGFNITNTHETGVLGDNVVVDGNKENGKGLPSTATNIYNLIAAGLAFIIIGTGIIFYRRRKEA